MRIGFYGDSFVHEMRNIHSVYYNYTTYLTKIKNHYDAEIINLGVGGSSYWDVIIKQFPPAINDLPDVCVFCWTDASRIFHPTIRNIGSWVTMPFVLKDFHISRILNYKKYEAAKQYFTHFYDYNKHEYERLSALYHFDNVVLKPIENKTKIIHMWSFGNAIVWEQENPYYQENIRYPYRFQTGQEIRPSLKCFSTVGRNITDDNLSANHLGSEENNTMVANMIINAIDNHQNGSLITQAINYNAT